ncbi:sensor domain-containing diguanylate cyclase [Cytobacillus sp. FSL K6-0265]|uniref:sensor domain-containing diguanylate cyclase n=1 Tax=Cytobacillus sp. FSL K6-0265 TaxID=2921448 RepID=UPI0030F6B477
MDKEKEVKALLRIKSKLLELIYKESTSKHQFDIFVKEVATSLGCVAAGFYFVNEWKKAYVIEGEYQAELLPLPAFIPIDEIYREDHPFYADKKQGVYTSKDGHLLIFLLQRLDGIPEYLVLLMEDQQQLMLNQPFMNKLTDVLNSYVLFKGKMNELYDKKLHYTELFAFVERFSFHRILKLDVLLNELLEILQRLYPSFQYYLLLTHDYEEINQLPVRDLDYQEENSLALDAYVSGKVTIEQTSTDIVLYAPFIGSQGVYGVLQVITKGVYAIPKADQKYFGLVAKMTGAIIENIQLHQQSQQLIGDLQFINETSQQLNADLRFTETIHFMTEQIKKSFHAEEVGFFLSQDGEKWTPLSGSTSFFFAKKSKDFVIHVQKLMLEKKDALFIGDLTIPHTKASYRSLMAVPMGNLGAVWGFVVILHPMPYYFPFDSFKLLQALIHHTTLAFKNSLLREELEKLVVTDHLTQLFSRSYLDNQVEQSLKSDEKGVLILIDIDDFKMINDEYGHQVGDDILIQVSEIIIHHIRTSDVGARWGGEELAIYLPNVDAKIGVSIARRLKEQVSRLTSPGVSISCGVSHWKANDDESYATLFHRADVALYEAKNAGKNKVVFLEKDRD